MKGWDDIISEDNDISDKTPPLTEITTSVPIIETDFLHSRLMWMLGKHMVMFIQK